MGNYKPKTANQFRWMDSKKIQKFIQGQIVVNDVNFEVTPGQDINVYNFNTVPEAKTIAETVKYCYENDIPLIIYDTKGGIWVSTAFASNTECYISRTINNEIMTAFIDTYDDYIEINPVHEKMLSSDNVKTLFGQTITGTGDINLYRHEIITSTGRTSYDETEYKVYLTYYSSNNLEANTPEKLTTLTKANTTTILRGIVLEFANADVQNATVSGKYSGVNYVGPDGWTLEKTIGGSDGTAITSVSDIVTPIYL